MSNLYDWDAFEFTANDGSSMTGGSNDAPNIVGGLTFKFEKEFSVIQNAIQLLWNANNGDPADFQYLRVVSDTGDPTNGFVLLELTVDVNGVVKTTPQTVALAAGMPFKLFSSQAYANYTINFGGGTLEKINQLRVKNLNPTTANVRLQMAN